MDFIDARTRDALCIASAGAAAVHFTAVEPHMHEWRVAAAFMLVCGVAQFAWALWVARHGSLLRLGATANGATALLWLVSRTSGIPFGPMAWQRERLGLADALASALEVLIVVIVLARNTDATQALFRLAALGTALVAFAPDSRGRLIAGATFTLIALARAHIALAPFIAIEWRFHEAFSRPRRVALGVRDPARAHAGARG